MVSNGSHFNQSVVLFMLLFKQVNMMLKYTHDIQTIRITAKANSSYQKSSKFKSKTT